MLSGKICAKASWLTQNFEVGKLALFFGANDFGGTILEENVVTAEGEGAQTGAGCGDYKSGGISWQIGSAKE